MQQFKAFRSLFSIVLVCIVAWSGFSNPALAASNSTNLATGNSVTSFTEKLWHGFGLESFLDGFWNGFGNAAGGVTGAVVTCYAVDALIVPVAPPVGAYLSSACPGIGAIAGIAGKSAVKAEVSKDAYILERAMAH